MKATSSPVTRRKILSAAGAAAAGWLCGCRTGAKKTPAVPSPAPAGATAAPRQEVTLQGDRIRVVADPAHGMGLISFAVRREGQWLDVSPDGRAPGAAMKQCSWMMIPYSNRIENGRFTFEGREYQLRNGRGHAIHGDVFARPWRVVRERAGLLRCALRSADFADFNWPWPIDVEAELAVEGDVFAQRLRIRNRGRTPMPAGFGWHPYFNRTLTRPDEPVLLQIRFTGVYPDTNGNCIPAGPAAPVTPELDYSKAKPVPRDRRYDLCACGFDGRATIEWPESGVRLAWECSPNVTHFVYYNPIDRPYWAAEPAANANNGVNLLAKGDPTHGVIPLPAGGEVKAHFAIRVGV